MNAGGALLKVARPPECRVDHFPSGGASALLLSSVRGGCRAWPPV